MFVIKNRLDWLVNENHFICPNGEFIRTPRLRKRRKQSVEMSRERTEGVREAVDG